MPLAPPPPLATPPFPPYAPEAAGGVCACDPGWGGDGCADDLCVGRCGEHGMCVPGNASQRDALGCTCEAGWRGSRCEQDVCDGCSGHGVCTAVQIIGRKGGFETATREGTTTRFTCQCFAGWQGAACAQDTCSGCSGHGYCLHGSCSCHVGWRGVDCAKDTCPAHCGGTGRGRCERGACVCEAHRRGLGCELDTCPRSREAGVYGLSCGGVTRGVCARGACFCKHGWAGEVCARPSCPQGLGEHAAPCAGHGRCVSGLCACGSGWVGVACDVLWRDPPPPSPPQPPPSPVAQPTGRFWGPYEARPACTPEAWDPYQYDPPGTAGAWIGCCVRLVTCVEPRPVGYPGHGRISSVNVCRPQCLPPSPPSPSAPRAFRDIAPEFVPVVAPSLAAVARATARRRGRRDLATLFGELQPAAERLLPPAARADVRRVPPPLDAISTESHTSVGDAALGLPRRPRPPVRGWRALHELLQPVEPSRAPG